MRFGSVCSGIEAASCAWHPLGWRASFLSEIETFPRAVLAHHYPEVPLHGDFTTIRAGEYEPIDLLVGGTPCQSFSVAGLRGGLDDERGNLALEYLRLADRLRPRWLVWENVPGVLSSNGGRDFGAILGGMVELGYGFAYRVLDAQFFGVAQRRRRVFVVGYLGDWRRAAAVLFERHSLQGHPAPRREAGEDATAFASNGAGEYGSGVGTLRANGADCGGGSETLLAYGGGNTAGPLPVAAALAAHGRRQDFEVETFVAHSLRGEGFDASEDGTGRGTPIVPVAGSLRASLGRQGGNPGENGAADGFLIPAAFQECVTGVREYESAGTLRSGGPGHDPVGTRLRIGTAVRRLTPRECERLQGFPEIENHWTIRVCRAFSDQQKSDALAEIQSRKSPSSAWPAVGSGSAPVVLSAEPKSPFDPASPSSPVAVHVLIDVERGSVQLRSAERSISFAAGADDGSAFPLPTGIDSFAHLVALLTPALGPAMLAGRAASLLSTTPSSAASSGSSIVLVSGREIAERAAAAGPFIQAASRLSTSTTSDLGLSSEISASILETLSCCVVHAIASFIPERTWSGSSFDVRVTTSQGYTHIPWRKGMAPDGPRYKALGNSMAVPVMAHIGRRIQQVEDLCAKLEAERAA